MLRLSFILLGAAVAEEGFIVLAERPTKDKTILQEVKGQYRVIDYTGGYFKSAEMSDGEPVFEHEHGGRFLKFSRGGEWHLTHRKSHFGTEHCALRAEGKKVKKLKSWTTCALPGTKSRSVRFTVMPMRESRLTRSRADGGPPDFFQIFQTGDPLADFFRFRQPSDPFSELFAGFAGMPASSPDVIQCGEFKGSAKPDAGKVCYRPADKSCWEPKKGKCSKGDVLLPHAGPFSPADLLQQVRSVTVETEKRQTQLSVAAKELEKLQARLGKESSAKWKLEAQLQTQTTEFKECSAQLKSTSTSRWKLHEELQAKVEKATAAKDEADRRARREKQDLTARLRAAEAALRASEAENERLQVQLGVETREKEQLKGLLRAAEKAEQKEQISSFTSAVAKWTPTGWFSPAIRKQLGADTWADTAHAIWSPQITASLTPQLKPFTSAARERLEAQLGRLERFALPNETSEQTQPAGLSQFASPPSENSTEGWPSLAAFEQLSARLRSEMKAQEGFQARLGALTVEKWPLEMTPEVEVLEPVEVQGRRAAGWERVSAVQAKEAWPLQVFPEAVPEQPRFHFEPRPDSARRETPTWSWTRAPPGETPTWSWTPEPETTELVASSGIFERLAARFSAGPKGEGRIPSRLGSRAQHTWPLQRLDAVESSGRLPASTLRRLRLSCLESAEKEDPWPVQVHLSAPDSSAAFAKLAERFSAELQGRAASTYPHPAEEGRIPPREDLNLWAPVHDANLVRSTRDERARLSAQISLSPLARLSRPVSVMKFDPVLSVPKVLKSKFLSISSFEKLDVRALHVPHASPRTSKALSVVPYQKIEPKALSVVSYEKLDAKTVTIAPYERFRANWSHRAAVAESTAGLSIANFEKLDAKVLSLASFEKVESTALSVRSYEKILPKAHAYENFESTVLSLQPIQRVDSTALSVRPRTETRSALESLRASVAAARLGRGGPTVRPSVEKLARALGPVAPAPRSPPARSPVPTPAGFWPVQAHLAREGFEGVVGPATKRRLEAWLGSVTTEKWLLQAQLSAAAREKEAMEARWLSERASLQVQLRSAAAEVASLQTQLNGSARGLRLLLPDRVKPPAAEQVWNASLRPAIVGAAAAPRVLKLTLPRGVEAKRSQGQGLREMVHLAVAEGIASCARNFSAPSSEMARALGEAKAQLAAAAQLEKERLQDLLTLSPLLQLSGELESQLACAGRLEKEKVNAQLDSAAKLEAWAEAQLGKRRHDDGVFGPRGPAKSSWRLFRLAVLMLGVYCVVQYLLDSTVDPESREALVARCAPYWEKLAPHAEKAAAVLQAVLAQCQRAQPLWARAAEWLVPLGASTQEACASLGALATEQLQKLEMHLERAEMNMLLQVAEDALSSEEEQAAEAPEHTAAEGTDRTAAEETDPPADDTTLDVDGRRIVKIAAPGVDAADVQVTTQFNGAVVEMRREFKGEAASWTKQYSFPVDQGPFALIAEELKLEQGFLHVVFEQSSFVPQTFHLPPAVQPPPVCADYFHLATPELSEADSDDFALVESFEA